jgi:hypothetical protein
LWMMTRPAALTNEQIAELRQHSGAIW